MNEREHQLLCKIYYFEDALLRSKNTYEIERLRIILTDLRYKLQKVRFDKNK